MRTVNRMLIFLIHGHRRHHTLIDKLYSKRSDRHYASPLSNYYRHREKNKMQASPDSDCDRTMDTSPNNTQFVLLQQEIRASEQASWEEAERENGGFDAETFEDRLSAEEEALEARIEAEKQLADEFLQEMDEMVVDPAGVSSQPAFRAFSFSYCFIHPSPADME